MHACSVRCCCTVQVVKALLEFAHALASGDAAAARLPAVSDPTHSLPPAAADFADAADVQPVPPVPGAFGAAVLAPAGSASAPAVALATAPGTPSPAAMAPVVPAAPASAPAAPAAHGTLPIAPIAPLALSQGFALGPGGHDLAAAWRFSGGALPGVQGGAQAGAAGSQPLHAHMHVPAGSPAHAQPPFAFAVARPPGVGLAEAQPGFPAGMMGGAALGPGLPHALPPQLMPQVHSMQPHSMQPHSMQPGASQGLPQGLPHGLAMQGALPPGLLQGFVSAAPPAWPAAPTHGRPPMPPAGAAAGTPLSVAPLFVSGDREGAAAEEEESREHTGGSQ